MKTWKPFKSECPYCGSEAEVLTDETELLMANDGDEARCSECKMHGSVSIVEEGMSACNSVKWHDEPGCRCDWCAKHPE